MSVSDRGSSTGIWIVLCLGILMMSSRAYAAISFSGIQPDDNVSITSIKTDFNPFNNYETYVVTFFNTGSAPLLGPAYLAIEGIAPAATSVIWPGSVSAEGIPFHRILDPVLAPGERHARVVIFKKPKRNTALVFSPRIYRPGSVSPNAPPVADAGPDTTARVGETVVLDGTGSTDVDGDLLNYHWSFLAIPQGSAAMLSGDDGPTPSFTLDAFGDYRLELTVNDGRADSVPDTVRISTLNSIPVAHAGPDQTVFVGDTVLLDGTGSSDTDGDPLTYQWVLSARPENSAAALDNPFIERPAFYVDQPGAYELDLIVDDGSLVSVPDRVVITTQNSRPVARAGNDIDAFTGDSITLDGSGSTDADADVLGYQWSLVAMPSDSSAFIRDGNSEFAELVADIPGIYVVQLIVSDGLLDSDPDTAQINVTEVVIPDSDGDGLSDMEELELGTDPGSLDSDGDGLSDGDEVNLHHTDPLNADSDGDGLSDGVEVSQFFTNPLQTDTDGDGFEDGREIAGGSDPNRSDDIPGARLPPDPSAIASPLDPTVATNLFESTEFLYAGNNPVQTGMSAGTIEPRRAAVLRGLVLDRGNNSIPGVVISVRLHPEYGQTLTRTDGMFDLAVNGGGYLTIDYQREGYLPVQRTISVPWQVYTVLPDVVMVPVDSAVTTIDLDHSVMQVARGNEVSDPDGFRQATLLFLPGTVAELVMPDGSVQALETMNVRATEYSVGENGPQAMPGELPPASGYTYAVDFSVDEAMAAGADSIRFNQPVMSYVENFLDFPVGWIVPSGYYDRHKAAWIASGNGLIVQVLADDNGMASLDVDGSGEPADASVLAELGISPEERQQLASLYSAGQSLWRVPVSHFSPWDYNWPYGPPADVDWPDVEILDEGSEKLDDPECRGGSIIECQNQVLGEMLDIAGTPFSLHYRSDRVPGRTTANRLQIRISGDTTPSSLRRIILRVHVGGRRIEKTYSRATNQVVTFTWDGLDVYGRRMQGLQNAFVQIEYVFPLIYYPPTLEGMRAFASLPGGFNEARARERGDVRTSYAKWMKLAPADTWDSRSHGMGGWTLSEHHFYDPNGQVLHKGNGERRSADSRYLNLNRIIVPMAGNGVSGHGGDGGSALTAQLTSPRDVAVGNDGSVYIADPFDYRVRRITPDGIITTYAGNGSSGFSGDNGTATSAEFDEPSRVEIGADGSLYISDTGNNRIRRVDANGSVTTVVGSSVTPSDGSTVSGCPGELNPRTGRPSGISATDGCLATDFILFFPGAMAFGPDGRIYVSSLGTEGNRIFEVTPDGHVRYFAGSGEHGYNGDGIPASEAWLTTVGDMVVAPDGSLIFSEPNNQRIRRIDTTGIIHTYAGTGEFGFSGDGGPANSATFRNPDGLALNADGELLIADATNQRIRRVRSDGTIITIAGNGESGSVSDNGLPINTALTSAGSLAVGPDGDIYLPQPDDSRVYVIAALYPRFSGEDISIPSSDGGEIYQFDQYGRHLGTVNAYTGSLIYRFDYDGANYLTQIIDGDNNTTLIERNPLDHGFVAIDSPDNLRTTATLGGDGYLASMTNPAGETYGFSYLPGGLLQRVTDPRGSSSLMQYDSFGRLVRDEGPLGGYWGLSRSILPKGHRVNMTSALGKTTIYQTEEVVFNPLDVLAVGGVVKGITYPDGTQTRRTTYNDGRAISIDTDGTTISTRSGPDPRLGMLAPILTNLASATPSGLSSSTSVQRTIIPATDLFVSDVIDVNGRISTRTYDVAAQSISVTSPEARAILTKVDDQGRIRQRDVNGLDPISYEYDARGRLATIVQGDGVGARTTILSYDASGFLDTVTDTLGRVADFDHDPAGRVTRQTLPDGRVIDYRYDPGGNLVSITPPGREAHLFEYTALNQEEQYVPPHLPGVDTVTRYRYNLDKQLTRIERPDGQSVTFDYDFGGRLSVLGSPQGQYLYAYASETGRLSQLTTQESRLDYTWDGFLPMSETMSGDVSGAVSYVYDTNFWRTGVGINGDMIAYGYDNDGLMTRAGELGITRDAANGLLNGTELAGITTTDSYNGAAELIGHTASIDGSLIAGYAYSRDALGRITGRSETLDGASVAESYAYDLAGRLIGVTRDGVTTTWGYDANGNRTHQNGTPVAAYDAQDRLLTFGNKTYSYSLNGDLAGKMEAGMTTSYDYDALGNLRHVILPGDVDIEYVIDGRNRRVGKKVNGTLVQGFLYQDQLNPVAEIDGAGDIVSRFVYAEKPNVPSYMIRDGVVYRILSDHLGSPRLVIDVSDGSIVQRIDYDVWGRIINDTNPGFQPFGFAGGLYDQHTGLVRFGSRDYDPETGRWTAKDPIIFQGGDANLYGYVLNDPTNLYDLDGEIALNPITGAAAGAIGGAAGAFFGTYLGGGGSLGDAFANAGEGFLTGLASGFIAGFPGKSAVAVGIGLDLLLNGAAGAGAEEYCK
ncbi:MAG: hypothetical protein IPM20_12010 [Gammaproteobacteria bacterium]|nr:hypothetical protein [Gammaproteobacteria bacterium]